MTNSHAKSRPGHHPPFLRLAYSHAELSNNLISPSPSCVFLTGCNNNLCLFRSLGQLWQKFFFCFAALSTIKLQLGLTRTLVTFRLSCNQIFQKCHHDIKKTWKLVNEIIAIKNKSQQNNKLFEDSECQKQYEDLNNVFSEVGKSLPTKIKPSPTTYRLFITHINPKNSLFLAPTDAHEIQLLIKNLKMKSKSSPNDIPSKFLKIASCIVSEWLSKLFNKCMTTGEFPDSWKIAHITPIPNVHSPSSSSEYRSISVLPVLSKSFEKIRYHRARNLHW